MRSTRESRNTIEQLLSRHVRECQSEFDGALDLYTNTSSIFRQFYAQSVGNASENLRKAQEALMYWWKVKRQ